MCQEALFLIGSFWHEVPVLCSQAPFCFLLQKGLIPRPHSAQLGFTFPFAAAASSEMLVVFVSLEVS